MAQDPTLPPEKPDQDQETPEASPPATAPSKNERGRKKAPPPVPISTEEGDLSLEVDFQPIPKVEKRERLNLSRLSKNPEVAGVSEKEKLQARTLPPIVSFFIWANILVLAFIGALALIEHFFPVAGKEDIITDKVMIAAIAGITIQTAAIIIAAFKGLFSK